LDQAGIDDGSLLENKTTTIKPAVYFGKHLLATFTAQSGAEAAEGGAIRGFVVQGEAAETSKGKTVSQGLAQGFIR